MTIEMRPFTKSDWFGFAGASRFPDGSEPMIGELRDLHCEHEGEPAVAEGVVVLDPEGLSVFALVAGEHELEAVNFDAPYAARAIAGLRHGMSYAELKAMPGAMLG